MINPLGAFGYLSRRLSDHIAGLVFRRRTVGLQELVGEFALQNARKTIGFKNMAQTAQVELLAAITAKRVRVYMNPVTGTIKYWDRKKLYDLG